MHGCQQGDACPKPRPSCDTASSFGLLTSCPSAAAAAASLAQTQTVTRGRPGLGSTQ